MDRSKLPLSLLVALGLAPEACTTKDGKAHPCLSAPIDEGGTPPDTKGDTKDDTKDPPVGPCLKVMQPPPDKPDEPVGPCLEIAAPEDPPVGPCLKVKEPDPPMQPCLSMPAHKAKARDKPKAEGGMAMRSRSEVIERVRGALPPDVAARLPSDDPFGPRGPDEPDEA